MNYNFRFPVVRVGISWLAVLTLPFILSATISSSAAAETKPAKRPKIGLVLEGGGALGFAHVGVLKVLEEEHIPVHLITGTSMGSIVGAAYASGRSVPELETVLSTTDWDQLFNESIPRRDVQYRMKSGRDGEIFGDTKIGIRNGEIVTATALVEGQSIEPLFQDLFRKVPPSCSFDALPIPYRAVAADIETGEAIVLDHGSLALAARASMSVPGFFSPVEMDGRLLVDGGVTNNFPVDVAHDMGADYIIGVEFGFEPSKRKDLTGPIGISAQILALLTERTSVRGREMMRPQDIMIHPDVTGYTSTSFTHAKEIMKAGEDAARKAIPALRRFAIPADEFAAYQARRTSNDDYAPTIDYIRVEGVTPYREQEIRTKMASAIGKTADYKNIEHEISAVHQTGDYRKVGYTIEEKDGKHGLVVQAAEKDWLKNYVSLGASIEDDFDGQSSYGLAAELKIRDLNDFGGYLNTQLEIGRSPRIFSELYQPIAPGSPIFISPEIMLSRQELQIRDDGETVAEYQREFATAGLKSGISFGRFGEWNAGYRRGPGTLDRQIGDSTLPDFDYDIGEFFTRFVLDQYDNPDFPTEGYRFNLTGTAARDSVGSSSDFEQGRVLAGIPLTLGSTTLFVSGEAGASSDNLSPERSYSLGGFFDISGFSQGSLTADNYWVSRNALYYRLAEGGSSIFKFGGYLGGTLEFASLRSEIQQIGDNPNIVAGSVFVGADTPLLPVYLGVGFNDESEQSVYLAVGRLPGKRR